MSSILEEHYNSYLEYDIVNYELYKTMLNVYFKNKTKQSNISEDDLYEFAKKEYANRFDNSLKKKMNEEFRKNTWGLSEKEIHSITSLIGKLHVLCKEILPIENINLNLLFSIDSYSSDYYKCLEKVISGFELKQKKNLKLDNENNKLSFKLNN